MKTLLSVLLGVGLALTAWADTSDSVGTPKRTPEELQKLLAPIAIYPDALIGIILPAAAAPSDIVLAARYLAANGDPNQVDKQEWDPSVVALAHYPELVKWMDENLAWTREVGEAFALQPTEVMSTVQNLRSEAQSKGLLADTPQQKVIVRESQIYIEPTSPDVIYVPYYDPDVFFIASRPYGPWLSFSTGFVVGSWLSYDCDWHSRRINVYHHPAGWVYRPDWRWHERDHSRFVGTPWRPGPAFYRRDFPRADHSRVVRHVDYPRWHRGSDVRPGEHARGPGVAREGEWRGRPENHTTATPPSPGSQTWGPSVANHAVAQKGSASAPPAAAPSQPPSSRPRVSPEQRQNWRRDNPSKASGSSAPAAAPTNAGPAGTQSSVQAHDQLRGSANTAVSGNRRPERIGAITPREGARPVVRQPDAVSHQPVRNAPTRVAPAPRTVSPSALAPVSRAPQAVQAAPVARSSAPSQNTPGQRGDGGSSHGVGRNRDR